MVGQPSKRSARYKRNLEFAKKNWRKSGYRIFITLKLRKRVRSVRCKDFGSTLELAQEEEKEIQTKTADGGLVETNDHLSFGCPSNSLRQEWTDIKSIIYVPLAS